MQLTSGAGGFNLKNKKSVPMSTHNELTDTSPASGMHVAGGMQGNIMSSKFLNKP